MKIISHYGLWHDVADKNRPTAFQRSFDAGFGSEIDVRNRDGLLVATNGSFSERDMRLPVLLDMLDGRDLPLAISANTSGIGPALAIELHHHGAPHGFVFGMHAREMPVYWELGVPFFTPALALEDSPPCYEEAAGIWLDPCETTCFEPRHIAGFLGDGKQVCIASPELRGNDSAAIWAMLRNAAIDRHPGLMLCTDRPREAAAFFRPSAG